MQATVYNLAGDEVETIDLDETIFGITPNTAVVHQAVLRQQANARQGTHETKTRAFVSGGGKKPWRQKGTGRARQGSTRSPQWRHGGVVFGPHPRSYEQDMPRKMRRLAIRSVLSSKVADGHLVLVDSFDEIEPRTKAMAAAMTSLNIGGSALIFVPELGGPIDRAAANLPHVKTLSAHLLSVVDMLKYEYLVLPRASLEQVTDLLKTTGGRRKLEIRGFRGNTVAAEPAKPAAKSRAKKAEAAAEPEAEAETAAAAEVEKAPKPARAKKAAATAAKPRKAKAEAAEAAEAPVAPGLAAIANVQATGEEYVEIANNGDSPIELAGYVLRDANDEGQSYTFEEGASLEAGKTLRVYTKPGHDFTFNSKRPIWNDKGDALELLNAEGEVVSSYAYGSHAGDENEG